MERLLDEQTIADPAKQVEIQHLAPLATSTKADFAIGCRAGARPRLSGSSPTRNSISIKEIEKLVGPSRRREAVLPDRLVLSERRACRVLHAAPPRRGPRRPRCGRSCMPSRVATSLTAGRGRRCASRARRESQAGRPGVTCVADAGSERRTRLSPPGGCVLRWHHHVTEALFQFDQADGRVLKLLNVGRRAHAGGRSRSWPPGASTPSHRRHARVARRGTAPGYIVANQLAANVGATRCRFTGEPAATSSSRPHVQRPVAATSSSPSSATACLRRRCSSRTGGSTTAPAQQPGLARPAAYAERWEAQQHAGLS